VCGAPHGPPPCCQTSARVSPHNRLTARHVSPAQTGQASDVALFPRFPRAVNGYRARMRGQRHGIRARVTAVSPTPDGRISQPPAACDPVAEHGRSAPAPHAITSPCPPEAVPLRCPTCRQSSDAQPSCPTSLSGSTTQRLLARKARSSSTFCMWAVLDLNQWPPACKVGRVGAHTLACVAKRREHRAFGLRKCSHVAIVCRKCMFPAWTLTTLTSPAGGGPLRHGAYGRRRRQDRAVRLRRAPAPGRDGHSCPMWFWCWRDQAVVRRTRRRGLDR